MSKLTAESLFAGHVRNRLPGMHMCLALDGRMPFREAVAAFVFMLLHDHVEHTCLIEAGQQELKKREDQAFSQAKDMDGAALVGIFGCMASAGLALEEWSYLFDEEAQPFLRFADLAAVWIQRMYVFGRVRVISTGYGDVLPPSCWSKQDLAWLRAQPSSNPFERVTFDTWHGLQLLLFSLIRHRWNYSGAQKVIDAGDVATLSAEFGALSQDDRNLLSMATAMVEENLERWVSEGVEPIVVTERGPLVVRPSWAISYEQVMATRDHIRERREYVEGLRRELPAKAA